MRKERVRKSYASGGDPDCKHKRRKEGGYGSAASFEHCLDCGATITHPCGHDPFYQYTESQAERGEWE